MKPRDLALDAGLAVLCVLLALGFYAWTAGPLSIVTLLGMAAALAIRRVAPGPALALSWVTALAQVFGGGLPELSNLAILAVLFASSAHGSRLVKWCGFASAFAGAAVVTLHLVVVPAFTSTSLDDLVTSNSPGGWDLLMTASVLFVGCLVLFLLSWVLGLLAKTYSTARTSRRAQVVAEASRAVAERETLVEQERTRIARDMHDVVAHSLAVVIAQADGARYARSTDDAAVESALTTIAATARSALGDVRVLLAQLREDGPAGPQPGLSDLDDLFAQLRGSGLRLAVRVVGTPAPLPPGQQLAVFRIIQEALTNALRHGDASREVHVELEWGADALALVIRNALGTGAAARGPDPASGTLLPTSRPATPGHGLAGMRERALLAGGAFSAGFGDGHFTVTATLPLPVGARSHVVPVFGADHRGEFDGRVALPAAPEPDERAPRLGSEAPV